MRTLELDPETETHLDELTALVGEAAVAMMLRRAVLDALLQARRAQQIREARARRAAVAKDPR